MKIDLAWCLGVVSLFMAVGCGSSSGDSPSAPSGAGGGGGTSAQGGSGTNVCAALGLSCTKNADCCGFTAGFAQCVSEDGTCHATCSKASDCSTNCCVLGSAGISVCFAASACSGPGAGGSGGAGQCSNAGGPCAKNADCCGFQSNTSVCVSDDEACHDICTANDQCQSNCCATTQDGTGVCAPSNICQ